MKTILSFLSPDFIFLVYASEPQLFAWEDETLA